MKCRKSVYSINILELLWMEWKFGTTEGWGIGGASSNPDVRERLCDEQQSDATVSPVQRASGLLA
jgi:hypothetical protein